MCLRAVSVSFNSKLFSAESLNKVPGPELISNWLTSAINIPI